MQGNTVRFALEKVVINSEILDENEVFDQRKTIKSKRVARN